MVSTVLLPQNTKAASALTLDEVGIIVAEYLKLNENDGTVIIEREQELKSRIGEMHFNEVVQTTEKLNEVIASPEGKKIKEEILNEVYSTNSTMMMARISGCGMASLAGAGHTAAFTGLMTIAGISGPAGWAIGTAVAGAWLGAGAIAGCLN